MAEPHKPAARDRLVCASCGRDLMLLDEDRQAAHVMACTATREAGPREGHAAPRTSADARRASSRPQAAPGHAAWWPAGLPAALVHRAGWALEVTEWATLASLVTCGVETPRPSDAAFAAAAGRAVLLKHSTDATQPRTAILASLVRAGLVTNLWHLPHGCRLVAQPRSLAWRAAAVAAAARSVLWPGGFGGTPDAALPVRPVVATAGLVARSLGHDPGGSALSGSALGGVAARAVVAWVSRADGLPHWGRVRVATAASVEVRDWATGRVETLPLDVVSIVRAHPADAGWAETAAETGAVDDLQRAADAALATAAAAARAGGVSPDARAQLRYRPSEARVVLAALGINVSNDPGDWVALPPYAPGLLLRCDVRAYFAARLDEAGLEPRGYAAQQARAGAWTGAGQATTAAAAAAAAPGLRDAAAGDDADDADDADASTTPSQRTLLHRLGLSHSQLRLSKAVMWSASTPALAPSEERGRRAAAEDATVLAFRWRLAAEGVAEADARRWMAEHWPRWQQRRGVQLLRLEHRARFTPSVRAAVLHQIARATATVRDERVPGVHVRGVLEERADLGALLHCRVVERPATDADGDNAGDDADGDVKAVAATVWQAWQPRRAWTSTGGALARLGWLQPAAPVAAKRWRPGAALAAAPSPPSREEQWTREDEKLAARASALLRSSLVAADAWTAAEARWAPWRHDARALWFGAGAPAAVRDAAPPPSPRVSVPVPGVATVLAAQSRGRAVPVTYACAPSLPPPAELVAAPPLAAAAAWQRVRVVQESDAMKAVDLVWGDTPAQLLHSVLLLAPLLTPASAPDAALALLLVDSAGDVLVLMDRAQPSVPWRMAFLRDSALSEDTDGAEPWVWTSLAAASHQLWARALAVTVRVDLVWGKSDLEGT